MLAPLFHSVPRCLSAPQEFRFIDAFGQALKLDLGTFKSWRIFQALLHDISEGSPIELMLTRRQFILSVNTKPPSYIKSRTDWERNVKPGMQVTMFVTTVDVELWSRVPQQPVYQPRRSIKALSMICW